jgi:hypothetical protein
MYWTFDSRRMSFIDVFQFLPEDDLAWTSCLEEYQLFL